MLAADGFIPRDDVLRHAAKVISGKDWSDILVYREGIYRGQDSRLGWHFILGLLHGYPGLDGDSLVVFSFIFLLLLFFLLEPWAEKMSRSDRMIIKNTNRIDPSPAIPQLEWRFVYPSYWVGKPRNSKNP